LFQLLVCLGPLPLDKASPKLLVGVFLTVADGFQIVQLIVGVRVRVNDRITATARFQLLQNVEMSPHGRVAKPVMVYVELVGEADPFTKKPVFRS
jgi:hypothetical protein